MTRLVPILFSAFLGLAPSVLAQSETMWETYVDRTLGFSAQLPLGTFQIVEVAGSPGLALEEVGGGATISLYGGPAAGLTRDTLEASLSNGSTATRTTYRAGGDSWFVLSGYEGEATIFYTKVMFSADHETFSAFEITFPTADKPRLEALVEQFEDNFTRPRS